MLWGPLCPTASWHPINEFLNSLLIRSQILAQQSPPNPLFTINCRRWALRLGDDWVYHLFFVLSKLWNIRYPQGKLVLGFCVWARNGRRGEGRTVLVWDPHLGCCNRDHHHGCFWVLLSWHLETLWQGALPTSLSFSLLNLELRLDVLHPALFTFKMFHYDIWYAFTLTPILSQAVVK